MKYHIHSFNFQFDEVPKLTEIEFLSLSNYLNNKMG